jgi:hypothetical protein
MLKQLHKSFIKIINLILILILMFKIVKNLNRVKWMIVLHLQQINKIIKRKNLYYFHLQVINQKFKMMTHYHKFQ